MVVVWIVLAFVLGVAGGVAAAVLLLRAALDDAARDETHPHVFHDVVLRRRH